MARVTKKQQVIEFIKGAGPKGLTFSEIQRFVVEKLNGLNYDHKDGDGRRVNRGYWCIPLCGYHSPYALRANKRNGILEEYCYKNLQGYYIHKDFVK